MKLKPSASKVLKKLWQDIDTSTHHQRLYEIKTHRVGVIPDDRSYNRNNGKKLVKLDEKYSEIERENHILLQKLKNIISKKQDKNNNKELIESNFNKRKKKLQELTKVNRKFLVTLNNSKSWYNFKEMDKDRKEKEKLIKNIWEFEAPLINNKRRNESNLKCKKAPKHNTKSVEKYFKDKNSIHLFAPIK